MILALQVAAIVLLIVAAVGTLWVAYLELREWRR